MINVYKNEGNAVGYLAFLNVLIGLRLLTSIIFVRSDMLHQVANVVVEASTSTTGSIVAI